MCGCTDAVRKYRRAGARAWRQAACVLAACLIATHAIATNAEAGTDGDALVRIYADAVWYKSRLEPERRWRGILRRLPVLEGPGSRTALTFALVTAGKTYPVYAAGVEGELAPFTGRWVEVVGKLVDLGDEGFGEELWIGTARAIRPAAASALPDVGDFAGPRPDTGYGLREGWAEAAASLRGSKHGNRRGGHA
jgi:hypothetical protein